jgi:integrase
MTTRDGRRRQAEKAFRGTRAAAERALNGLLTAPAASTPDGRTFGQLLDEWLSFSAGRRAAKTVAENRRKIETDIRPALGSVVLIDLTTKQLDDAYATWLRGANRPNGRALSTTSVHHLHAIICAALSQAVRWGYIADNPAAKASPPAITPQSAVVPTPEVIETLILKSEECNDRVMAAAISLAFITGARRGELCGLRWSDVVFAQGVGVIRIERAISDVDNVITVKETKAHKRRTVPIDARSITMLQEIRARQELLSERTGLLPVDDPYVLSQAGDGSVPFEPGRLTDRFRLICGRARVRGVRFHDLRHAHITYLIEAGIDVETVAARAGDSQPTRLLNRYAHALPTSGQVAATVIGGLLPS